MDSSWHKNARSRSLPAIFQTVSRETVWKIAEGLSTRLLWRQETADRPPFDPFWTLAPGPVPIFQTVS